MTEELNRRSFLKLGLATTAATSIASGAALEPVSQSLTGINYVTLGRTGMRISDISFGSSQLRRGEEHLVNHAFERGINYFDTADSYTGVISETVIGKALQGKRDKVFIATKTRSRAHSDASFIMQSLEDSLRKLKTDYVDIFFNHAVNDLDRLRNPEWLEFSEIAKQQGKIRFTGMSGHAGNLTECVDYAVENEMFDVFLLSQNFGQDPAFYEQFTRSFDLVAKQPDLPAAMARAKAKNIGIIGMKVLRGARLNDMRPFEKGGNTYAQAAFKWTLSTDYVDAAIVSMKSIALIDEFLGTARSRLVTKSDFELLEQYARMTDLTYCRHACNDCESACPLQVPIADVLRTRMYAVDYNNLEFAKAEYRQLGDGASACLSCDGKPCQGACTHGISIARYCGPTHVMLS